MCDERREVPVLQRTERREASASRLYKVRDAARPPVRWNARSTILLALQQARGALPTCAMAWAMRQEYSNGCQQVIPLQLGKGSTRQRGETSGQDVTTISKEVGMNKARSRHEAMCDERREASVLQHTERREASSSRCYKVCDAAQPPV
ncbi:hypothetical protein HAX54_039402 [Datura stramonium]|uniref:Uncharacterized protein n=1 Tax=Datura stramonium TaxID=4076 RepID=A0ABS8SJ15_DATST|nr:hypothetical protein [Datura stramonium]